MSMKKILFTTAATAAAVVTYVHANNNDVAVSSASNININTNVRRADANVTSNGGGRRTSTPNSNNGRKRQSRVLKEHVQKEGLHQHDTGPDDTNDIEEEEEEEEEEEGEERFMSSEDEAGQYDAHDMIQISATMTDNDSSSATPAVGSSSNDEATATFINNALLVGIDNDKHSPKNKKGKSGKAETTATKSGKKMNSHHQSTNDNDWQSSNSGGNVHPTVGEEGEGMTMIQEDESKVEMMDYDDDAFHWDDEQQQGSQQGTSGLATDQAANAAVVVHGSKSGKGGKATTSHHNQWNNNPSAKPTPTHEPGSQQDHHTNIHDETTWNNTNNDKPYTLFDTKSSKLFNKSKSSKSKSSKQEVWMGGGWWPPSGPTNKPSAEALPTSSMPTMTPTYESSSSTYPPLSWRGVNGCTPSDPCPKCTGDCDTSADCNVGLECYKRNGNGANDGGGEIVPGCTSGGVGDIPGADYCYDPSMLGDTPTSSPLTVSSSYPTYSPVVGDDDTPSPTMVPTPMLSTSPVTMPYLTWVGVNGCTPTQPCEACSGDCDTDSDCASSSQGGEELVCYKRADGETDQVPGCRVGGMGDIPGADYCSIQGGSGPPGDASSNAPSAISVGELPGKEPTPSPHNVEAYFLRSQSKGGSSSSGSDLSMTRSDSKTRSLLPQELSASTKSSEYQSRQESSRRSLQQQDQQDWCASGALSPDSYPLIMEPCIPDSLTSSSSSHSSSISSTGADADSNPVVARMKQMDQLWHMDSLGYIHSVFDYDRCMMAPSASLNNGDSAVVNVEIPIEIGPCNDETALNRFSYAESSSMPNVLTLQGYDDFCVTFKGDEVATKGSPMMLTDCQADEIKFGWDFVLESNLDNGNPPPGPNTTLPPVPSPPSSSLPTLRYLGRDGCNIDSTCQACSGDCDTDEDCSPGLQCFERAREDTTQVPGCDVGGPGDIAGADYCYDPTLVDNNGPSPSPPSTDQTTLTWLGAQGCNADSPCPACTGDCDDDSDCLGSCFRRLVGETTQIPGCEVGGIGDVPGGDYCYDPSAAVSSGGGAPSAPLNPGLSRPTSVSPPVPSISPPTDGDSNSSPTDQSAGEYPTFMPSADDTAGTSESIAAATDPPSPPKGVSSGEGSSTPASSNSSNIVGSKSAKGPSNKSSSYSISRARQHASTRTEREHEVEEEMKKQQESQEEIVVEERTREHGGSTRAEREGVEW